MEFQYSFNMNFNANTSWTDFSSSVNVPSELRPGKNTFTILGNNGIQIVVQSDGSIRWANRSSSTVSAPTLQFTMNWRKK